MENFFGGAGLALQCLAWTYALLIDGDYGPSRGFWVLMLASIAAFGLGLLAGRAKKKRPVDWTGRKTY